MRRLEHVRRRLAQRLEMVRARLEKIDGDLGRERNPLDRSLEERSVTLENDEVLEGLSEYGRAEATGLVRAIELIDRGVYGTCLACGKAIPRSRLEALPAAIHCVACAPGMEWN